MFRMSVHCSLLDLPRGLADCNKSALFSAFALQKCEKVLMFDVCLSNWFHVYFAVTHAVTLLLYYQVSFVWAFSSMHVEITAERCTSRPIAQAVKPSADLSNAVQKSTCPVSMQFGRTWHFSHYTGRMQIRECLRRKLSNFWTWIMQ